MPRQVKVWRAGLDHIERLRVAADLNSFRQTRGEIRRNGRGTCLSGEGHALTEREFQLQSRIPKARRLLRSIQSESLREA
jgi:hypothetical protein